eukprot:SAG25_NODE_2689_length_1448_cov_1.176427_1_plen_236_part_00
MGGGRSASHVPYPDLAGRHRGQAAIGATGVTGAALNSLFYRSRVQPGTVTAEASWLHRGAAPRARCAAASDLAAILCRCRHETAAEGQPGGSCGTGSDGAQGPSRAAGRMQPYLAMMLDRGPAATDAPTQSRAPQLTLLQAAQRRLAFALGMRSGLPGEVTDMDVVAAVCAHVTGLRWSRHELDKPLAKYVEFNNIKLLEAGLRAGRDPNDPKEFTCPISDMENCAPLFIAAWCD